MHGDIRGHRLLTQAFLDADVVFTKQRLCPFKISRIHWRLTMSTERHAVRLVSSRERRQACCVGEFKRRLRRFPESPKKEDLTPKPLSPYAATKCMSEVYAKMYNDVCGSRPLPTLLQCLRAKTE